MREDNLLCLRTRRFVPATTDSQHGWRVWPNLARGLVTRNLNELWVADITYVRLQEEFVYVAVVLDAHSRRVIGWALAQHLGASVAVQSLRMALLDRHPAPGLIHHSDRGIQYACADYLTLLADHGVQPSMSRMGIFTTVFQDIALAMKRRKHGGSRLIGCPALAIHASPKLPR